MNAFFLRDLFNIHFFSLKLLRGMLGLLEMKRMKRILSKWYGFLFFFHQSLSFHFVVNKLSHLLFQWQMKQKESSHVPKPVELKLTESQMPNLKTSLRGEMKAKTKLDVTLHEEVDHRPSKVRFFSLHFKSFGAH